MRFATGDVKRQDTAQSGKPAQPFSATYSGGDGSLVGLPGRFERGKIYHWSGVSLTIAHYNVSLGGPDAGQ